MCKLGDESEKFVGTGRWPTSGGDLRHVGKQIYKFTAKLFSFPSMWNTCRGVSVGVKHE